MARKAWQLGLLHLWIWESAAAVCFLVPNQETERLGGGRELSYTSRQYCSSLSSSLSLDRLKLLEILQPLKQCFQCRTSYHRQVTLKPSQHLKPLEPLFWYVRKQNSEWYKLAGKQKPPTCWSSDDIYMLIQQFTKGIFCKCFSEWSRCACADVNLLSNVLSVRMRVTWKTLQF